MQHRSGFLLLLGLACAAQAEESPLPSDIQAFIERRDACDHWRGEEPYDAARQWEISKNVCDKCKGTDNQLVNLKAMYRGNVAVSSALAQFASSVELPSQAAFAKACSQIAASQPKP